MPELKFAAVEDEKKPCLPFMGYVQELPEEQYATLLKDIGATESSVAADAKLLREWMLQEPHLPNLGEEWEPWLARFLVGSKNSLQRAKEYVEKYCTQRGRHPDMFEMGPQAPIDRLFGVLKSTALPTCTAHGTRIIITRFTKELGEDPGTHMDWKLYFTLTIAMADYFLAMDRNAVDAEIVIDLEHFTVAFSNSFMANLGTFRQLLEVTQGSIPLHYKAVHLLNAPAIIKTVMSMVRPFLKDKLGERIQVHEDLNSLHSRIEKDILPKDYGGAVPKTLADMCDDWYVLVNTNRPWMEYRNKVLAADETKRIGGKSSQDDFGVEGSFRKLAVD